MSDKTYTADVYLRISKDDGDKEESDSIANQRDLILDFLKSMQEISVNKIRIDDGYSGVDFNRPAFKEMIEDITCGVVNCVVVKDFSRFGRNYIETGKYIQVLFPKTGVRFIAVNENYDSIKTQGYSNNLIVPFKNIINDAYSADISVKVRSHIETKRKKGYFVGAFAVYGYLKNEENHNKLTIDTFASDVVRDIFIWKLNGMSALSIAERLNKSGVLSPAEYKRHIGVKFSTPFKTAASSKWSANAVSRILTNEVYIGVMEQGKRVTPNYKVRKRIDVPKEQWVRCENTHEPIIDQNVFRTVQKLLKQDTRAAFANENVRPLSGVIQCADCGAAMVHKTNSRKGKRYGYYVCSKHRSDKTKCSTHIINSKECEASVLAHIKTHIIAVLNIANAIKNMDSHGYSQGSVRKLSARLEIMQDELRRNNEYRLSLYESFDDKIITKDDFVNFKSVYDVKIKEAEATIIGIKEEIELLVSKERDEHGWIDVFLAYTNAETLTRKMVVELIESVDVYEKGRIEIKAMYIGEYKQLIDLVKGDNKYGSEK